MATKTARILSYLPATFRAAPVLSALKAVVGAPGSELLAAENTLAALMRAHWVDHADRGAQRTGGLHADEAIDDLARIAALYGLAPRPNEAVEEFREHLKRYVRTFLEGTVTVQGILRVTAEALGLEIADGEIDTWWNREAGFSGAGTSKHALITREPRDDDAAELVLGVSSASIHGRPATPAKITGTLDLSAGFDLGTAKILRLKVGAAPGVAIDLESATDLEQAAEAINSALGKSLARHDGRFLSLVSPTVGTTSRLEVPAGPDDAAGPLLGLRPRTYTGSGAEAAAITGDVDLSAGVDLGVDRYLRISVDGTTLAEIDCAGADPAATSLDEIATAIDAGLGVAVASHDGRFLTLTSPTAGVAGSLVIQKPAAQDAAGRLFGATAGAVATGRDPRAARIVGPRLGETVDLSARSQIRLRVDQAAGIVIDCAGVDPRATRPDEIVAAINGAFGSKIADRIGDAITLTSPKVGTTSRLAFLKLPEGDASGMIFGISPRIFRGAEPEPARLVGQELADADLRSRRWLQIAIDDDDPVVIDLRQGAADPAHVTLDELTTAIRHDLGRDVASHDGQRLILTSPANDGTGSLTIQPLERVHRRRFVSRAILTDEAAPALFGFASGSARGTAATAARIAGTTDLARGVDLRQERFLRLRVDGGTPVEIDCAGSRPRATTLDEVVGNIDTAVGVDLASHDGRHLILTSPAPGPQHQIRLEASQAGDALRPLLGIDPGEFRGTDATRVVFTGTHDLATGVDLDPGAAVKIGTDGGEAVEIVLSAVAARLSLDQLTTAINLTLGASIAGHDGRHLILTSPSEGAASALELAVPTGPDATPIVLGVATPRTYQGRDAQPAVVTGHAVSGSLDLSTARTIQLTLADEQVEIDVTTSAASAAAVTLDEAAAAITEAFAGIALVDDSRLILTSPTTGLASRLTLERSTAGDARARLFGEAPDFATGQAPQPAVLTGDIDLLSAIDLEHRRSLRLRVDGGASIDIDVAGTAPAQTLLLEVVAAINEVLPGLATATADDRLQLTSPSAGETSRLEVMPRRYLEVVEYPPQSVELGRTAVHGERWWLRNSGAAGSALEIQIDAPHGVFGAAVIDLEARIKVRVLTPVAAGGSCRLRRDAEAGLVAEIISADGEERTIDSSLVHLESLTRRPGGQIDRDSVLFLPRGRSRWLYMECTASRFNRADFDEARFAGAPCREVGVFDASRFSAAQPGTDEENPAVAPEFAGETSEDPPVEITSRWRSHRPGAFEVNLPVELPTRFGGRFGTARFGTTEGETYSGVALELPIDGDHLISAIGDDSTLVAKPELVPSVPLGFEAATAPFRQPCLLTLGGSDPFGDERPAALYLAAEGLDGFLKIEAKTPGEWGNGIAVTARPDGPARYEITVHYAGAVFENARQAVRGAPLPSSAGDLLEPGPVGVLQAKAAGIEADVTRDRAELKSEVR